MRDIVNMQVQKTEEAKIEEMRIDNRVQITKVFIGGSDEYILLSGNDISLIDRFVTAGDDLEALAEELAKEENAVEEKDHKQNASLRLKFSQKATEIMDAALGDGSTKKFFGDVYNVIPDFCPDIEAFMDFWDALIPVIEKLSDHKVKLEKLASRKRMGKYQPQDHQKPAKKR